MTTAAERLADQRAIEYSVDLQIQLDRKAGLRPMIAILKKARDQARLAINSLIYADPSNVELVRAFQNEVRRYDDLVAWCQEVIVEGIEADQRLSEAEREEFSEILLSPDIAEEARAFGAQPMDYDA
jgi:hypothetical protein